MHSEFLYHCLQAFSGSFSYKRLSLHPVFQVHRVPSFHTKLKPDSSKAFHHQLFQENSRWTQGSCVLFFMVQVGSDFLIKFVGFLSIRDLLLIDSLNVQSVASELVERLINERTKFQSGDTAGLHVVSQLFWIPFFGLDCRTAFAYLFIYHAGVPITK